MKKSVCVDLDGVLAQYDGWKGVEHIGDPIPGAVQFTKKLQEVARVVIFTTRTNADPAIQERNESVEMLTQRVRLWLDAHGFAYDEIYVGQGKPLAAAYVDDRAVECQPQRNACEYLYAFLRVKDLVEESK